MKLNLRNLVLLFMVICIGLCFNFVSGNVLPKSPVKIDLEDIILSKYRVSGWSGSWVSDALVQRSVGDGHIVLYNVTANSTETKFNATEFSHDEYPGRSFTFSADENYVLLTHTRRSLWRHSFLAKYDINTYNTSTTIPVIISEGDEQQELQLFEWSPVGNGYAFVYGNNIYYRANVNDNNSTQLTIDGENGEGDDVNIINGHTDWVYEEEMFGDNTALWFSPYGNKLAYIKFNDTEVKEFSYPIYGEPGNENTTYPDWIHIRYPKSGETNPTASLYIIPDLASATPGPGNIVTYPASDNADLRHYIATVKWLSEDQLLLVHLDRSQQIATWFRCNSTNATSFQCFEVYSFNEPNGWIDISNPMISTNGSRFLTTKINDNETTSGLDYKHIVLVNLNDQPQRINNENYSVDSILRWDESTNYIYFTATGLSEDGTPDPSETHVYRILDNSTIALANCITCNLNTTHNEKCRQHSMSFSTKFGYSLHTCSGPVIPETVLRQAPDWNVKYILADNNDLRTALDNVELPTTTDFVIPHPNNSSLPIRARLFLPSNFNPARKYPLFIDVYGGPGSQNIRQGFSISWRDSLVSTFDIIYGYIDGRGSARQTGKHLFELRDVLGTVEIEDQIIATKWLIEETGYIDAERTAIWGWSYGGYATAMVLAKDSENVFKCGISVAPVTNWWYYDTIYTERFMGEPKNNVEGYAKGDVTTAENALAMKNHSFFLIHGNADDNVHYQQSMILARALEQQNVMFYQLSYPDEDHSIAGTGMRRHLYNSIQKFLFLQNDCLAPNPNDDDDNASSSAPATTVGILSMLYVVFSTFLPILLGYYNY